MKLSILHEVCTPTTLGDYEVDLGREKGFQNKTYSDTYGNFEKATQGLTFSLERGPGTTNVFANDGRPRAKTTLKIPPWRMIPC